MEIIVAKNSGFCIGVKSAIEKAESIKGGCVTLGKLIHNEIVIKDLESRGVKSINSLDEYNGGVLLIRSHGVGKDIYEAIESKRIEYVDATCPFVKKIHKIVFDNYNSGKKIIIIGDNNHPEVLGTNGWCNYSAQIISSELDIPNFDPNFEYCVVCQTTFDEKKYEHIIKKLKNAYNLVVNNNTICYTTTCRQDEALELSLKCDIILVIGSKTSSNTNKLFDICAKNCKTYLIESLADVKSVEYKKNNIVGIVAGASTPQELIEEVKTQMSESQETKNNVKVENVEKEKVTSFAAMYSESQKAEKQAMSIKPGKVLDVKVISANEDGITVNFGGKKDGFIAKENAEVDGTEYDPANYKQGDSLKAKVIDMPKNASADVFYLSKRIIDQSAKDWEEYAEILKQPEFKAEVKEAVKSGLKVKIGPYDVFIPSSQIKKGYVTDEDLPKYVGKSLRLRVIKSKKDDSEGPVEIKPKKPIYASQRVILEEEAEANEKALWEFFVEGKIVSGKVARIRDFGAFVKVNGFECLAHKSNLSYKKDATPESVIEVGKTYDFMVLNVDKEKRQVSLGYKQLQKSPYELAFEKYPVGSTITGAIRNITNYGVYVYIEDGVDGLVPVAEISHRYIKNPADVYKVGDEVTAQVIKFDVEKNKITLSIKALISDEVAPIEVTENDYKASSEKRTQRNLKKFENVDATAPRKRVSRRREEVEEEPQTWGTEANASVSVGDLLKSLVNIDETENN